MNRSIIFFTIIAAAGALGVLVVSGVYMPAAEGKAAKKIRRSCQQSYVIRVDKQLVHLRATLYPTNREEGARWFHTKPFEPAIPDIVPPLRMKSSARCGKLVPNRCRSRASRAAFACMEALRFQAFQTQRWSGEAIDSMQNPNAPGPPPDPDPLDLKACPRAGGKSSTIVEGALDFQGETIAGYFKRYVCASVNSWLDTNDPGKTIDTHVGYTVFGRSEGNKGCGDHPTRKSIETRVSNYGAICKRERNATSDIVHPNMRISASGYKQIKLTKHGDNRCRKACLDDPRCLSWDVDSSSKRTMTCELYERYHPLKKGRGAAGMK